MDTTYFLDHLLDSGANFCYFEFSTFSLEYLVKGLELCNNNYIIGVTYYVHLINPDDGYFLSDIFTFEFNSLSIKDEINTYMYIYDTLYSCMELKSGYTKHLIMYISDEPLKDFIN